MNYWLVKSEPFKYAWEQFVEDGIACWDGVRNYQARNNLRSMKKGDLVLFYHSNEGLAVMGIAKVSREAYQDPTTEDPNWVAVDLKPYRKLKKPVSLAQIKAEPGLKDIEVLRLNRLSVVSLKEQEFDLILAMGTGGRAKAAK
ncbi:MAG: EVE domain-containing protein [Bacteroidia bacterium]|nr:EVE domain-containing protein [Bacteroidia bacterium]